MKGIRDLISVSIMGLQTCWTPTSEVEIANSVSIIDRIQSAKEWTSCKSRVAGKPSSDTQVKKPYLQVRANKNQI